jgi:homoserine O-acetyltransferase/O-succinyltransferase
MQNGPLRTMTLATVLAFASTGAALAEYPAPVEGSFTIPNFTFENGEVLPEMKVAYLTIGDPTGEPVLLIHGTTGSAKGMLAEGFADQLFGPGQPLDASQYYIILPDTIGAGGSSKPSDGLRAAFPAYTMVDMVNAQKALVSDHLGIPHLRLVIGNSMGGMVTWTWGTEYPDYMDALVPMASVPGPMSGRNWMMRRMVIDSVRNDPAWRDGNYTEQPEQLRIASAWFAIATAGGEKRLQKLGATSAMADAFVDERLANTKVGDANDTLYQWEASRTFDPTPKLKDIEAAVLVINSEDDERNPPELDLLAKGMAEIGHGEVFLIPSSDETMGHGTTFAARYYSDRLREFLATTPKLK